MLILLPKLSEGQDRAVEWYYENQSSIIAERKIKSIKIKKTGIESLFTKVRCNGKLHLSKKFEFDRKGNLLISSEYHESLDTLVKSIEYGYGRNGIYDQKISRYFRKVDSIYTRQAWEFEFDSLGNRIIENCGNMQNRLEYDSRNNLIQLTRQNCKECQSHRWLFQYDSVNQMIEILLQFVNDTIRNIKIEHFKYDQQGNLIQHVESNPSDTSERCLKKLYKYDKGLLVKEIITKTMWNVRNDESTPYHSDSYVEYIYDKDRMLIEKLWFWSDEDHPYRCHYYSYSFYE